MLIQVDGQVNQTESEMKYNMTNNNKPNNILITPTKYYAFWKTPHPPYLSISEISTKTQLEHLTTTHPTMILPLEKGIKIQKKINKAYAKYKASIRAADEELSQTIKSLIP